MKLSLVVLTLLFSLITKAETISLYAQACLPYVDRDGSLIFNCDESLKVNLEMIPDSSGELRGNWSRSVQLGDDKFLVEISAFYFKSIKSYYMTGMILSENGTPIVSTSKSFNPTDQISLTSFQVLGKTHAFPHFFFGGRIDEKLNKAVMANTLKQVVLHKR